MAAPNATLLQNPFTPLAFVPSSLARKITIQNYTGVGSSAVLLWDIILHLPDDYKLARRHGINKWFIIYCIARVTSLAYLIGYVIVMTAPVGDCNYIRTVSILYPFTIPLTILPLVIRVFALYQGNKFVIAFFSITWLCVLASCVIVPINAAGVNIGPTKYCLDLKKRVANEIALLCLFLHDSLIFLATSWALMRFSYADVNMKSGIRLMLGKHLPAFSKSILRDGQFYYLMTLLLHFFFLVMFYTHNPPITPCATGYAIFVMLNTLSSYVYRNMRLGFYKDYTITSSVINKAVEGPLSSSQDHRGGIVFHNPISAKNLRVENNLEVGDIETQERANL